jgi:hypothetical protein
MYNMCTEGWLSTQQTRNTVYWYDCRTIHALVHIESLQLAHSCYVTVMVLSDQELNPGPSGLEANVLTMMMHVLNW